MSPVVGEGLYDGKPGAAMRAVRKRVEVTAVVRVENLFQALRAGGDIWKDEGAFFAAGVTVADDEILVRDRIEVGGLETLNVRMYGLVLFQTEEKAIQPVLLSLRLDENPLR
jgi:hypothetical protein